MDAYERAYKEGLKNELIERLRLRCKEWRAKEIDARDAMYDLEIFVQEIWGEEEWSARMMILMRMFGFGSIF